MSAQPQAASPRPHPKGPSLTTRFLGWLTSMNLAITLLMILAMASVIGTVLKQNQPFNDYLAKFGPFWFDVFHRLSLYDVYSSTWFVVILVFLVISTSLCVGRNAPGFLRDIRSFRLNAQEKSLRGFHHREEMTSPHDGEELVSPIQSFLKRLGYKSRVRKQPDEILISGRKGGLNRIGYILTHLGIVVILLGGLLDSKMQLKLMDALGQVKVETRDLPVSQVPADSKIPVGGLAAFRGTVNIPEGKWGDVAFIGLKDGYVVQNLPFKIYLKKFQIEHYNTGMPKSFKSAVVITDKKTGKKLTHTVEVNHPLHYHGYNIFQASFGDGGTKLTMDAWQLRGDAGAKQTIKSAVFQKRKFDFAHQKYRLEFTNFRMYNINPIKGPDGQEKQKNFGPSVTFKLRDATGQAIEYQNFFNPVEFKGHYYFLSGVKRSVGGHQEYLYIPADRNGSIKTFMSYLKLLHDRSAIQKIAANLIGQVGKAGEAKKGLTSAMTNSASASIAQLVQLFVNDGFPAVQKQINASLAKRNLSAKEHKQAQAASIRVVQSVLMRAYMQVLSNEGVKQFKPSDSKFFDDAMDVISVLPVYGSPIFLQPVDFKQIQSTGLEISRAPGRFFVYIGALMLVGGIFMLFYIHYRRLWILIKPSEDGSRMLIAGSDVRKNMDFDKAFKEISTELAALTQSNINSNPREKAE